jgi:hypothetical protein
MNRKKKIHEKFSKRLKKAKAKLSTNIKPKYVAKADRAKAEFEILETSSTPPDNSEL